MFDAIICDPPYGVRAGGKKSVAKPHMVTNAETHIPSTDAYTFEECLRDLLHLAAKHLKLGGRLVFFMPSVPGIDKVHKQMYNVPPVLHNCCSDATQTHQSLADLHAFGLLCL